MTTTAVGAGEACRERERERETRDESLCVQKEQSRSRSTRKEREKEIVKQAVTIVSSGLPGSYRGRLHEKYTENWEK